jgi:hypothetical protein
MFSQSPVGDPPFDPPYTVGRVEFAPSPTLVSSVSSVPQPLSSRPSHYEPLPKGAVCNCPHAFTDVDRFWCCRGLGSVDERALTPAPSPEEPRQGFGPIIDPAKTASDSTFADMSLRDYFAGQVLTSITMGAISESAPPEYMAICAYKIADAMMIERAKRSA